tara:strand:- start:993 stop:1229 length:237 start_codon:yes stop_codon:yes gene_type:complete
MKILTIPFIILIKIYQNLISPLTPATCRFEPTCSHYSIEALKEHGVFKGTKLMVIRIFSCHPWGRSGYDPVPKKNNKK